MDYSQSFYRIFPIRSLTLKIIIFKIINADKFIVKKNIGIFSLFIVIVVGIIFIFKSDEDSTALINKYRHRIDKKQINNLNKRYILNHKKSPSDVKKNRQIQKREIAQESKVIKVANPLEKREELKKEYSHRGHNNRVVGSLGPNSPIVYGDGNGNQYKLLEDYVAIKKTKENENDFPNAQVKLGHFIVPKDDAPADALILMENASSGIIAIFTGLIKAKLSDINMAQSLISSVNYDIPLKYEHIGLVMYKFDSYQDTMLAKKELDRRTYVQRATIELLEYERIAQ